MKNLIIILILVICNYADAQDPILPQERVVIKLTNGKIIKDAQLWSITNGILEYESNQVLNDVYLKDIKEIKGNFIYQISETKSEIYLSEVMENTPISENNILSAKSDTALIRPVINDSNLIIDRTDSISKSSSTDLKVEKSYNYYAMGQADAKKYYKKGNDRKIIRMMAENPNLHLLQINGEYKRGYLNEISRQKRQSSTITLFLVLIPFIILATAI